jgi:septum formation protein
MTSAQRTLILASGSPQRKRLLAEAGYRFEIVVPRPHAECGVCSKETPGELVARLARQKADDVRDQLAQRPIPGISSAHTIVACDTVAECLGQILGKPENREHARQMLERLSGREHRVHSGLAVWPVGDARPRLGVARTTLRMDPLSERQIEEYLNGGQWEGKAGAFGYQDRVGWLRIIEGSESNVIGLPMELLAELLHDVELAEADQAPPRKG